MDVSVSFVPVEFSQLDVSEAAVVVIDCFRASTSIVAALNSGAKAVYPFLHVEEARKAGAQRPGAVLGGERHGARIDGFHLGNSPAEYSAQAVGGREVVMTTTNGTRLLAAASKAREVYVGGFVNAATTASALVKGGCNVVIAAAGTEGRFSIEDSLCAGFLVTLLGERARFVERDSATFARFAFASAGRNLRAAVENGRGATNIKALGLEADIDVCLALDSMPIVAKALEDPLRVVRVEAS